MLCSSISRRSPVRLIQITIITHSTTTQITVRVRANISISPRNSLIADSPVTSKDSSWYEACSDKCLGYDFRREETPQLFRSNTKGIRSVDHDLAVPLFESLRNIFMSRKWDSEKDHLRLISVLNGLGKDAGTEFF